MLWKIYFFVLFALTAPTYLLQSYNRQWEIIDALFFSIGFIALFGFVWNKIILGRRFWQAFVPVYIVWNVAYHYLIPPLETRLFVLSRINLSRGNAAAVSLIILLPTLNAVWCYAFEKKDLWFASLYRSLPPQKPIRDPYTVEEQGFSEHTKI